MTDFVFNQQDSHSFRVFWQSEIIEICRLLYRRALVLEGVEPSIVAQKSSNFDLNMSTFPDDFFSLLNEKTVFSILFSKLGDFFTHADQLSHLFRGSSEKKREQFTRFVLMLMQLSFFGRSESRILNPRIRLLFGITHTSLEFDKFKKIILALDGVDLRFLQQEENIILKTNLKVFYSPALPIAVDDDKVPCRSSQLREKHCIAPKGGRTTRVYPTVHEINLMASGLNIGRVAQLVSESTSQALARITDVIKTNGSWLQPSVEVMASALPNLIGSDRGYDLSPQFTNVFGTLKRTEELDFYLLDYSVKDLEKVRKNQFRIHPRGCQTLYAMKKHNQLQLAFCCGNEKVVFLNFQTVPILTA